MVPSRSHFCLVVVLLEQLQRPLPSAPGVEKPSLDMSVNIFSGSHLWLFFVVHTKTQQHQLGKHRVKLRGLGGRGLIFVIVVSSFLFLETLDQCQGDVGGGKGTSCPRRQVYRVC